jgi:serine/threonine-protein kinase
MITGKVPYDGDTPITIALKHIQEDVQLPGKSE